MDEDLADALEDEAAELAAAEATLAAADIEGTEEDEADVLAAAGPPMIVALLLNIFKRFPPPQV